jgi:hypothetical protein
MIAWRPSMVNLGMLMIVPALIEFMLYGRYFCCLMPQLGQGIYKAQKGIPLGWSNYLLLALDLNYYHQ